MGHVEPDRPADRLTLLATRSNASRLDGIVIARSATKQSTPPQMPVFRLSDDLAEMDGFASLRVTPSAGCASRDLTTADCATTRPPAQQCGWPGWPQAAAGFGGSARGAGAGRGASTPRGWLGPRRLAQGAALPPLGLARPSGLARDAALPHAGPVRPSEPARDAALAPQASHGPAQAQPASVPTSCRGDFRLALASPRPRGSPGASPAASPPA